MMNSTNRTSSISIFPKTSIDFIWQVVLDDIIGSIAYMFAVILSIKAIKAEKAPEDTLQNTSAIENVLDTYGNAILRLAYSYIHNMSDA